MYKSEAALGVFLFLLGVWNIYSFFHARRFDRSTHMLSALSMLAMGALLISVSAMKKDLTWFNDLSMVLLGIPFALGMYIEKARGGISKQEMRALGFAAVAGGVLASVASVWVR